MTMLVNPFIFAGFISPSDEPSLDWWLKADSLVLSDNDPVSAWADSSGSGFNYGAAGTARPTYKTNIVNGKPIVRFATNDVLIPTGSPLTYGENNTMIVVCTERTSGTGYIFSGNQAFGGVPEGGPAFITGFASKDFEYFTRGAGERNTFATTAAAGFHVLTLRRDDGGALGETYQLYFDGALISSHTVIGNDNWNTKTLAKIGDFSAGDFYNGDIAEMIHCNSLLGNSRLNDFHSYLGTKYGISITLL